MLAAFVSRPNRFVVEAQLADGSVVAAHLANTGRLTHLTTPGRPLILQPADDPARKTRYTVTRAWDGCWVALEAARAADLLAEWLTNGNRLPGFGTVATLQKEVTLGHHRLDLCGADSDANQIWIEVKSSGRVVDGTALLSETPSQRGAAHLEALAELATAGERSAAAFVIQRPDARRLRIGGNAEPGWVDAVRGAAHAGVSVLAFGCEVTVSDVRLASPLPVIWDEP